MASHTDPTPHAPRHSIPFHPPTTKLREAAHKTLRSRLQSQTLGRTFINTAFSCRYAMRLHPHAHLTATQPHTTTPRWPLRAHTRRPPATEPSSIILQANMNSTFFPRKHNTFSFSNNTSPNGYDTMVYPPPSTNTVYHFYTNNGNNTSTTFGTHRDSPHAMSPNYNSSLQTN